MWGFFYFILKKKKKIVHSFDLLDDRPANQTEPREAVVERVSSGQSVVAVLHSRAGQLRSSVIHLPHQVQPLPAGGANHRGKELKELCFFFPSGVCIFLNYFYNAINNYYR